MALARKLVALGRAARGEARLKVRQPLRRALLLVPGAGRLSPEVAGQVSEELNVKSLEVVESLAGLIRYSVVPNFRALGPHPRPEAAGGQGGPGVGRRSRGQPGAGKNGSYTLTIDGEAVVLSADDLEVRAEEHEEFALAQDGPFAVARSISRSTTTSGSKAWPASCPGRSTTTGRASGLAIADRIKVRLWAERARWPKPPSATATGSPARSSAVELGRSTPTSRPKARCSTSRVPQ